MDGIAATSRPEVLKTVLLACMMPAAVGCSSQETSRDAGFVVVDSRFLGSVWNEGQAKASIVSQDGGLPYVVPGGSLWWFGDTFRGSRDQTGTPHYAGGAVSCAVAFLRDSDKRTPPRLDYLVGEDGAVAQAIDFLPGESWAHHRIWPLGGIYLNGKSYVYYSLIEIGEGAWNFHSVGSGLACSTHPLGFHTRIQTAQGWRFPVEPATVVAHGDWLYLYDVQKRHDCYGAWLSRVRTTEIEDPNAYEYYCGPGPTFSRDKAKEVASLKNVYGQVSIAWNTYLQEYVLASSSDMFHPREIRFHVARQPFGPWSKPVAGIMVPESCQSKKVELVYCSYLHPELFREGGRIMSLTFSVQLADSGFDANNEAVEVELNARSK
jgi:hypothetical protein